MNFVGIVAEFNPLHNGHFAHITETRAKTGCKYIVAVISGNFVQRGEPAICNKLLRTKMALLHGVDLVIEIPVQYVISGADYFARGSVALLNATGVMDALCFGSESGNITEITEAGRILATEPELYKATLRESLDNGLSFAAAKGAALKACFKSEPSDGLLNLPNNGLAMEYCKALELLGNPMQVFTTHRVPGGPSATNIRNTLTGKIKKPSDTKIVSDENLSLPEKVEDILRGVRKFVHLDDFSDAFRYMLYSESKIVDGLSEGLGNRFRKMCGEYSQIFDLLAAVKTKRYTFTRLQRTVLQILLNISSEDMAEFEQAGGVQYIRVLGFRKEASDLLGEITRKAKLPVITHGEAMDEILRGNDMAAKMLNQELMAGDVYRLASGESGGYRSERGAGIVVV